MPTETNLPKPSDEPGSATQQVVSAFKEQLGNLGERLEDFPLAVRDWEVYPRPRVRGLLEVALPWVDLVMKYLGLVASVLLGVSAWWVTAPTPDAATGLALLDIMGAMAALMLGAIALFSNAHENPRFESVANTSTWDEMLDAMLLSVWSLAGAALLGLGYWLTPWPSLWYVIHGAVIWAAISFLRGLLWVHLAITRNRNSAGSA